MDSAVVDAYVSAREPLRKRRGNSKLGKLPAHPGYSFAARRRQTKISPFYLAGTAGLDWFKPTRRVADTPPLAWTALGLKRPEEAERAVARTNGTGKARVEI